MSDENRAALGRVLLGTSNPGKAVELRAGLAGLELDLISLDQLASPPPPPAEEGSTFAQNARRKAEYYLKETGIPSLADDSGLVVDALGGAPGIQSARYAPTTQQRIARLLRELAQMPAESQRRAHFSCAMCLAFPAGLLESEGEVCGVILEQPRGSAGFGYDPVFYYPTLDKTFAELTREEKNRISHRARALEEMRRKLADLLAGS